MLSTIPTIDQHHPINNKLAKKKIKITELGCCYEAMVASHCVHPAVIQFV